MKRRNVADIEERIKRKMEDLQKNLQLGETRLNEIQESQWRLESRLDGVQDALDIVQKKDEKNELDRTEDEAEGPNLLSDEGRYVGVAQGLPNSVYRGRVTDDAAVAREQSTEEADFPGSTAFHDELVER